MEFTRVDVLLVSTYIHILNTYINGIYVDQTNIFAFAPSRSNNATRRWLFHSEPLSKRSTKCPKTISSDAAQWKVEACGFREGLPGGQGPKSISTC